MYYSQGTGQGNMVNAGIPHAASLSSRGGVLMQDPFYTNGSAYQFSSNLPTYGGGATVVPSAGYPQPVQLQFSGPDLNNLLSGRVVDTMVPGLVMR
jgi:hypothetical protein